MPIAGSKALTTATSAAGDNVITICGKARVLVTHDDFARTRVLPARAEKDAQGKLR